MYDAFTKTNFILRAAQLWTSNDFPAFPMLSGWSTKGKLLFQFTWEVSGPHNFLTIGNASSTVKNLKDRAIIRRDKLGRKFVINM